MKKNKNIFVLPTDKPSKLFLSNYGKELNLSGYPLRNYTTGQNIYITSSDKEIKEGNWVYYLHNSGLHKPSIHKVVKPNYSDYKPYSIHFDSGFGVQEDCKKIILTTDQDLIAEGIQQIDDEFLEWFVKNPNCEWVDVETYKDLDYALGIGRSCFYNKYKIIIPKEEHNKTHYLDELPNMDKEVLVKMWESTIPKEEPKYDINTCKYFDQEVGCDLVNCHCEKQEILSDAKDRAKKETFEESACIALGYDYNNWLKIHSKDPSTVAYAEVVNWCKGAEWQAKRLYSEEEVLGILNKFYYDIEQGIEIKEWFEQFKKK